MQCPQISTPLGSQQQIASGMVDLQTAQNSLKASGRGVGEGRSGRLRTSWIKGEEICSGMQFAHTGSNGVTHAQQHTAGVNLHTPQMIGLAIITNVTTLVWCGE